MRRSLSSVPNGTVREFEVIVLIYYDSHLNIMSDLLYEFCHCLSFLLWVG